MSNNTQLSPEKEAALLFDKTYECPVCGKEFRAKKVRTGRVRMLASDTDLRPTYQGMDCLKYDAVVCPDCGYASLDRFFKFVVPAQAQMIRDAIGAKFNGIPEPGDVYTYEDALTRHKLALQCAMAKGAPDSEQAYTCLKMAWICRGMAESLQDAEGDNTRKIQGLRSQEQKLIDRACTGFEAAFSKEDFPVCGMDELTVSYLLAELSRRTGRFDAAGRWISHVLVSREASDRIKDRARDVKELLNKDIENAEKNE